MSGRKSKAAFSLYEPLAKTPLKNKQGPSKTAQKYLEVKLQYSEKKKCTLERLLSAKEGRIHQLQSQIVDNQKLVRQTLSKWKAFKENLQQSSKEEMHEIEAKVQHLQQVFQNTEKKANSVESEKKRLMQQNQLLKQQNEDITRKFLKLQAKYRKDKEGWNEICNYILKLISAMSKMPAQVLDQYLDV